ncbi:MAG: (deoxy)nucleoside triphosphate pyrophosphohydrolase [Clostridia bacterium]|nr:(deoxy)nucleoside triphosphate pyrophosphohydrolase [Clostridia bacterium]
MINVVGAIIRNKEGKILIAQRNLNKNQGGLWEFPGGKIEEGETKEKAIEREIKEELDMDIKCESLFDEHAYEYPNKTINLIVLNCLMLGDSYRALEHEDLK